MMDSVMPAPGYRILRRNGGGAEDVIVFGSTADPSTFSEAIRSLALVRRVTGDTASVAGEVRVRPALSQQVTAAPLAWAERVLTDLRRADRVNVPQIGRQRIVRIWLPSERHRAQP